MLPSANESSLAERLPTAASVPAKKSLEGESLPRLDKPRADACGNRALPAAPGSLFFTALWQALGAWPV
jgi:hypothetical protein